MSTNGCVFCLKVAEAGFARAGDVVTFEPLNPVTPGHLLVVPRRHVADAAEDPDVTAQAMRSAAVLARAIGGDCNIITSRGPMATQTVFHLHIHVVPRREGDGLHLPWTGQRKKES